MKRFLAWACALIVLAAGLCAGALAAREIFAGYALLDAEACLRDPEDHLGEKTFLRGRVEAPLPGDEGDRRHRRPQPRAARLHFAAPGKQASARARP